MTEVTRRTFLATSGITALPNSVCTAAEDDDGNSRIGQTPHTKFAVNIEMWWTKLPFLDRIRQTAALGFPAVEFWPWDNKDLDATLRLTRKLKI